MENQQVNLDQYKCIKYRLNNENRPRYAKGFYTNKNYIVMVGKIEKKSGEYIEVNTIRMRYVLSDIANITIVY